MLVTEIEAGALNEAGGRTVTIEGKTHRGGEGVCHLTFATAADLDEFRRKLA
jgi:hypothetical protein